MDCRLSTAKLIDRGKISEGAGIPWLRLRDGRMLTTSTLLAAYNSTNFVIRRLRRASTRCLPPCEQSHDDCDDDDDDDDDHCTSPTLQSSTRMILR